MSFRAKSRNPVKRRYHKNSKNPNYHGLSTPLRRPQTAAERAKKRLLGVVKYEERSGFDGKEYTKSPTLQVEALRSSRLTVQTRPNAVFRLPPHFPPCRKVDDEMRIASSGPRILQHHRIMALSSSPLSRTNKSGSHFPYLLIYSARHSTALRPCHITHPQPPQLPPTPIPSPKYCLFPLLPPYI